MNRRKRTEILIKGNPNIAEKLALEIESSYKVSIIQEPEYCLVMVKMRETAQRSLFYLGEVLATETKVQILDKIGIGIVNDNKPELSYWLAVIDAAYSAKLAEIKTWGDILQKEEQKINEERLIKESKILMTKVNFDTMDV
ncbi:phosphonate C-P lyase system protein PhnG [Clostridium bowmanii]|uniref:phosphonate C-P lyase system protein PhnG n=1 Tax=Clostridium bowmanii TaxID=132925 RepID=UPI001C0E429B|nr:phosphonate C-P lyase system protein PhnG [Clostridium bowmanii]MBU3189665.1 phosphonate C-P lyase system protein PhnG [Clostridium bowmanii]MCA1073490.1 phosphonate C-P lyase system protein PhnG [Clostridium bowmanii]